MDFVGRSRESDGQVDYSISRKSHDFTTCTFTVNGRISLNESSNMEDAINEAIGQGFTRINLDMKNVSFLSSVGIRVLLAKYKELRSKSRHGRLKIKNPSENVRNVIGAIALDEMLLK